MQAIRNGQITASDVIVGFSGFIDGAADEAAERKLAAKAKAQIEKTSQRTIGRPHWFEPANPNRNPIEHPSTMSPASNTSKEALGFGLGLGMRH